jgi:hypothetical protein
MRMVNRLSFERLYKYNDDSLISKFVLKILINTHFVPTGRNTLYVCMMLMTDETICRSFGAFVFVFSCCYKYVAPAGLCLLMPLTFIVLFVHSLWPL